MRHRAYVHESSLCNVENTTSVIMWVPCSRRRPGPVSISLPARLRFLSTSECSTSTSSDRYHDDMICRGWRQAAATTGELRACDIVLSVDFRRTRPDMYVATLVMRSKQTRAHRLSDDQSTDCDGAVPCEPNNPWSGSHLVQHKLNAVPADHACRHSCQGFVDTCTAVPHTGSRLKATIPSKRPATETLFEATLGSCSRLNKASESFKSPRNQAEPSFASRCQCESRSTSSSPPLQSGSLKTSKKTLRVSILYLICNTCALETMQADDNPQSLLESSKTSVYDIGRGVQWIIAHANATRQYERADICCTTRHGRGAARTVH